MLASIRALIYSHLSHSRVIEVKVNVSELINRPFWEKVFSPPRFLVFNDFRLRTGSLGLIWWIIFDLSVKLASQYLRTLSYFVWCSREQAGTNLLTPGRDAQILHTKYDTILFQIARQLLLTTTIKAGLEKIDSFLLLCTFDLSGQTWKKGNSFMYIEF